MDFSRQQLKVSDIWQINQDVRCYRFVSAHKSVGLEGFKAGQFISLFYEIDGATASRPYSIASSPKEAEEGYYDLYIHGGGEFTSKWLFEHVTVGDVLEASKPIGDFYIDCSTKGPVIGISGGMSVTPLRSMARAVADGSVNADITLFCGWDRQEDVLFFDEFLKLSLDCERFNAVFALADMSAPGMEQGYINREIICKNAETKDAEFFVCGPKEMYEFLERDLAPLQIPPDKYHLELPGEIKQIPDCIKQGSKGQVFSLRIEIGEKVHEIKISSEDTILVAMERAGIKPESRCRSGNCGYCRAILQQGTVFSDPARDNRESAEIVRGIIHTCCTYALSDLSLKFNGINE
ncbi:MAG: 2Fe-2S iron-sulfur cluster binding domain-containing protein [Clostridiaceae bacterium]|jgi:ferredoxin-NADP reductase|nr:2Fe-2S iron-sulfur cluster binding domain-containing protein [Clostridiaceae bacterium]